MPSEREFIREGRVAAQKLYELLDPRSAEDDNASVGVYFDVPTSAIVVYLHEAVDMFRLKEFVKNDGTYEGFKVYITLTTPYAPRDTLLENFVRSRLTAHQLATMDRAETIVGDTLSGE